ncbi:FRG domain-containing protein [Agarivorans sp. 1_MG-2023]|uniref:FRG domain-containing protein n=1 Tax=Agarivorans sp. 1_MG-2023 TaxID=3062634 RepID=UPI0026E24784|nr:FRG domain-containing protein [Agarivorans sp. 1_MG-2023]MDO6762068.1 FRG domain-containing protein [Agarivorans sp. 1_MG-2023]
MKVKTIISYLEELECHSSAQMFRGHGNLEWALIPSIARLKPKELPVRHYDGWKGIEKQLLIEFKKYALRHIDREPTSQMEWMIQAQHHGVPTRLLDWSTNPLKALYFAIENTEHDDKNGKLYVFTPQSWAPNPDIVDVECQKSVKAFHPIVINDRILAQEGCFTLFPQQDNHNSFEALEEGFSRQEDVLNMASIIIPKEAKPVLRTQLRKLGVTDMTMFPDLDGIAKKIRRDFGIL